MAFLSDVKLFPSLGELMYSQLSVVYSGLCPHSNTDTRTNANLLKSTKQHQRPPCARHETLLLLVDGEQLTCSRKRPNMGLSGSTAF